MIVVSRCLPSSSRNTLHSKLKLGSLMVNPNPTNPSVIMASHQSSTSLSTETPPTQPPPTKSSSPVGDWGSDLFTGDSKARAISLLDMDRKNCSFFKTFETSKKAAVLVPFCYDMQGRPGILYNLRSEHLSAHKGEISFPGGTLEPQDKDDPVAAALRETDEELGIKADQVEVWTTCRVFPTVSSKMGVVPVIGFIKSGPVDPLKLEICPDEVDHAFVITLEHLCNPSNWAKIEAPVKVWMKGGGRGVRLPVYQHMESVSNGLQGIYLWGLTAFITHLVLTAFVPERYTRKVSYIELMKEPKTQTIPSSSTSTSSAEDNGRGQPKSNSKL